jgi:MFS family permease
MKQTEKSFSKFLVLWSGELISAIGSGLTSFGLGVYVYQLTGKASATALITLLAFLPSILLAPFAGVLADRYDRRLMMILGDSLSALGLVFILICMLTGEVRIWQICIGVFISSVFSSLLDPAYKATITDLLTEEQYSKASGLVQVAGSSKYLISPVLAGFLLSVSDIKLLLIIDICTFFITVTATIVVRKGLQTVKSVGSSSFRSEFTEGWKSVAGNRGILLLVIITSLLTFFVGFIQLLSTPMVLAFSDVSTLGTTETICALGMLFSGMLIGFVPLKHGYVKILSVALFITGICMVGFGFREDIILICVAGFLFFATLPFANTCIDVLLRKNIENSLQGRAWAMTGMISQLGYIVAYSVSGVLADYVFVPMLLEGGLLENSVGRLIGTGSGRGIGFLIMIAGVLLSVTAVILYQIKSIRGLENKNVQKNYCEGYQAE